MYRRIAPMVALALALAACEPQTSRDHIKVVGSSTVYPFTTAVAEGLVNANPNLRAPVIESTGTGAGASLFCAGVGPQHPDILNASRRLKKSEYETCLKNGVKDIMEVQVGVDGVALAESNAGPKLRLTKRDVYLALSANPLGKPNIARLWRDVNPTLPAIPIQVFGPPATSGTRDALVELVMVPACEAAMPQVKALKDSDKDRYADICTRIRDDAAYVDKGENDNLIVQNLSTNPNAVGIFGYSYLEENKSRLHGVPIEGITPTYDSIADGSYPGARPLFIYVKKAHIKPVPGMTDFLAAYARSWNPGGPLTRRGMIAAPQAVRAESAAEIASQTALDPAGLH
ncbi:substrate-binding domain-containing protein [Sphingomonas sp. Leaf407]|nr:substrate-binding domain-containing protein [Sphingomonas sp. Leaf407]